MQLQLTAQMCKMADMQPSMLATAEDTQQHKPYLVAAFTEASLAAWRSASLASSTRMFMALQQASISDPLRAPDLSRRNAQTMYNGSAVLEKTVLCKST